jgi:mRNA capping enzyme
MNYQEHLENEFIFMNLEFERAKDPIFFTDDFEFQGYFDTNRKTSHTPEYINNQDYTLNSPLIADNLDYYIEYCKTGYKHPLYYNKYWLKCKNWGRQIKVNWKNLKPTNSFHKECARLWLKDSVYTMDIRNLINKADDGARQTNIVIEAYIKAWLGKESPFKSRKINQGPTLKYGAYMLESLKLIWLLNARTEYELNNLRKDIKFEYIETSTKNGIKYNSPLFGVTYLGQGFIYFESFNMFWDRNMLLMFKDTSTARFHTCFNVEHHENDPYKPGDYFYLKELYRKGDEMLSYNSEVAYDGVGMVEPISSLKLAELADSMRSYVPQFPHFREHVVTKGDGLSKNNPTTLDFIEHLHSMSNKQQMLLSYGSFRHWGHPFIRYMDGLMSLYANVTSTKRKIKKKYANQLASLMAFKILHKEFHKSFKWFVDIDKVDKENPLYKYIDTGTWPPTDVIERYPQTWHQLPLTKCWDIPEVVDPSLLYSDKTHSINLDEFIQHMKNAPNNPIPTRKVLHTLLKMPATDWPKFLKRIDEEGLDKNVLIIGLKAKEREIKLKGRFFALMSWELREYFVFTEYLIKKNVLPLFKGLTMADDQNTLVQKMMKRTAGQSDRFYNELTIANHIDYEKWNNFQRYASTAPVFTVIGKFHGYPNLFTRTHEFFEKSLIYYRDRPDLMTLNGNVVINKKDDERVCWNGQLGGLEGLRQKGWSVLNLLVIEKESHIRNTRVEVLAQGDNQVICTNYEINPSDTELDLEQNLKDAVANNAIIIERIRSSTAKIGLTINEDETLQSAGLLIYGKVVIVKGNIHVLTEKRFSRITCTTNDQLPSMANIMSTVSTNCLTVAHYSKTPVTSMINMNWLGNFVLELLLMHNPALRAAPKYLVKDPKQLDNKYFRILCIYLDPTLGGISGTCLSRYHVRMFPDPLTESLSFWKAIHNGTTDRELKKLACIVGNPKLLPFELKHFSKLIEDPTSLNLPRGLSAPNMIKDEIRKSLLRDTSKIKNIIIKDSVKYINDYEEKFINFLKSIKPCFPRFLSEFRSSSYFGLTNSILGLFENSKTIRNLFKEQFRPRVDDTIIKCELGGLESLISMINRIGGMMWDCSATQADRLRHKSWNREVVGTTIPHPIEMIIRSSSQGVNCEDCKKTTHESLYILAIIPHGIKKPEENRGPFMPYFGSSTSENTNLIQAWEKDTDINFLRKASELRRAFHWFIKPESNLGMAITDNLIKLTGEDLGEMIKGFKRTGSALHRFSCSRVSAGGYIANNSMYGSHIILSTDKFSELGDQNYDFMFQPLLLFAQQTAGLIHGESNKAKSYHFHISCMKCLRTIEEVQLDSEKEFTFEDKSKVLEKWKPSDTKWMKEKLTLKLQEGNWRKFTPEQISLEIGRVQGLMYGNLHQSYGDTTVLEKLFPVNISYKIHPGSYLSGLVDGLYRASVLNAFHRGYFYWSKKNKVSDVISACYSKTVDEFIKEPNVIRFIRSDGISKWLKFGNHRIPPSYPTKDSELGGLLSSYLRRHNYEKWRVIFFADQEQRNIWIFADLISTKLAGICIIANEMSWILELKPIREIRDMARHYSKMLSSIRLGEITDDISQILKLNPNRYLVCNEELRYAAKIILVNYKTTFVKGLGELEDFTNVVPRINKSTLVEYSLEKEEIEEVVSIPKIQNPLISAIRIPQVATGSFLKMQSILNYLRFNASNILCGGDGSGGISALLLRYYPTSRLIFNSLLDCTDVSLGGTTPSGPSAIGFMNEDIKNRCVNFNSVHQYGTDLREEDTWIGFLEVKRHHSLSINLAVFDMEITSEDDIKKIEIWMRLYLPRILTYSCTLIIKSYLHRLLDQNGVLKNVGDLFGHVQVLQTPLSSSHTSEYYVICSHFRSSFSSKLYPRLNKLQRKLRDCYALQSYEKEFNRAVGLLHYDLVKGIPRKIITNGKEVIQSIWESLVNDNLYVYQWMEILGTITNDFGSFFIAFLGAVMNHTISITRIKHIRDFSIPSDHQLSNVFSYFIGVALYISLVVKDCELAAKTQQLIDKPFLIFFYTNFSNKTTKKFYTLRWSFNKEENWYRAKKVYVQQKLAMIGTITRALLSMGKLYGKLNITNWDKKLGESNRALTLKDIQENTGCLDVFKESKKIPF